MLTRGRIKNTPYRLVLALMALLWGSETLPLCVTVLLAVRVLGAEDNMAYPLRLSEIRVRDPFILADSASRNYFLYAQCGNRRHHQADCPSHDFASMFGVGPASQLPA